MWPGTFIDYLVQRFWAVSCHIVQSGSKNMLGYRITLTSFAEFCARRSAWISTRDASGPHYTLSQLCADTKDPALARN